MFRLDPRLPVGAYKTYEIRAPKDTHWRVVSCAEAGCGPYLHGWRTTVDERTGLGQAQAYYVRHDRTRSHTEERLPDGLTAFTFPAGQRCFAEGHQVRVERPELYVVRGGDWRGNPTGQVRQHANADDWVEDFGTHQQQSADAVERG
jgi:hypothetical protein